MAKKKRIPDIQDRIRPLIKEETRLLRRDAERQRKANELELEFRRLLNQADALSDQGKVTQARKLISQAEKVMKEWRDLQPERTGERR